VRLLIRMAAVLAVLGLLASAVLYLTATRDPVVRRATVHMADWPAGASPMQVVLLSDIHVAGPDMPPGRLARIVEQVNALRPDAVLIAGDFVSDKRVSTRFYSGAEGLAPLARLRARHGVWAVLGNHDHWRDAPEISRALRKAGIRILTNSAATVGAIRLGGVDDDFTGRADVPATVSAMRQGPGSRVLLTHSPDVGPALPPDVTLLLAGHTHCGQVRLPGVGAPSYESRFRDRYDCGLKQEGRRRAVITAGLARACCRSASAQSPTCGC
jgi:predicted MPP superfamily phosphohydrolase